MVTLVLAQLHEQVPALTEKVKKATPNGNDHGSRKILQIYYGFSASFSCAEIESLLLVDLAIILSTSSRICLLFEFR